MKIYKELVQGSEEWLQARCGKFTASDFHIFLGESQTKKLKLLRKASERITGKLSESGYKNENMERGNELEDEARRAYEEHTLNIVEQVGFIELNEFIGCSPDGLIGDDGMIEIKCPLASTFLNHFVKGEKAIKPQYLTQIQFNFLVNGRKWCDYVVFHPDFPNKLYIQRIKRDEEYINKIEKCLSECNNKINTIIEIFNKNINKR